MTKTYSLKYIINMHIYYSEMDSDVFFHSKYKFILFP